MGEAESGTKGTNTLLRRSFLRVFSMSGALRNVISGW